jgi:Transglutaminase-like superfamily
MRLRQLTGKTSRLLIKGTRKVVLHPSEALLMCRMAWWVSVLSLAVHLRPLPRALSIVAGSRTRAISEQSFDAQVGNRLARTLDQLLSVDLLMLKPICWKRAAILHRYLSVNGIASRILFGVRSDADGKVSGHAWLESGGLPVLESQPIDYVVTYSFPSAEVCTPDLALLSTEQK